MISLKRLENFLFSKEYNKNQIVKNNENESKYAIFINGLDFGIIKEDEIEEENEKKEDKKSNTYSSIDSEERELEDFSEEESEKSQRITLRKSVEFNKSLRIQSFSKLQHTISAKNLLQLDELPKLRRKKFYSYSKRLSKSSEHIGKLKNRISNINHFYNTRFIIIHCRKFERKSN